MEMWIKIIRKTASDYNDEWPEETTVEYECPRCGCSFFEQYEECPNCGVKMSLKDVKAVYTESDDEDEYYSDDDDDYDDYDDYTDYDNDDDEEW